MTQPPRRNLTGILVGAVIVLLVVPVVLLGLAASAGSQQPAATRGPIQVACQGEPDASIPGGWPALPVKVQIVDGDESAYVLAGPAPYGLTYTDTCRITGNPGAGALGGGGGGTVGPAPDPRLSLDEGGQIDSEYPMDRLYTGRIGPEVTRVQATLASGTTVEATVSNGYYLVWARTGENAVRITAFDATGGEVRTIEDAGGLLPPH